MRPVRYASTRDIPGGVKVHIAEEATRKVMASGYWMNPGVLAYAKGGKPKPGYAIVAVRSQRRPKGPAGDGSALQPDCTPGAGKEKQAAAPGKAEL